MRAIPGPAGGTTGRHSGSAAGGYIFSEGEDGEENGSFAQESWQNALRSLGLSEYDGGLAMQGVSHAGPARQHGILVM